MTELAVQSYLFKQLFFIKKINFLTLEKCNVTFRRVLLWDLFCLLFTFVNHMSEAANSVHVLYVNVPA